MRILAWAGLFFAIVHDLGAVALHRDLLAVSSTALE
jgi:hypothetical protein